MTDTRFQRTSLVSLRLVLGWIFLYAGFAQVTNPEFSAAGFVSNAKTFPDFFAWFAAPGVIEVVSFAVSWGHLLIGLSLVAVIALRYSVPFAVMLNLLYWLPRLDFPMVGPYFLTDSHIVYALGLIYLVAADAGRYFSLRRWLENLPPVNEWFEQHPRLRPWLT